MNLKRVAFGVVLQLAVALPLRAGAPAITSFGSDGVLSWHDGTNTGISVLEWSADASNWQPVFYDLATNTPRSVQLPLLTTSTGFYRVAVRPQPADPSLILHFPFDSDFSSGMLLDASGHGNHGYRFGHMGGNTNWPSPTIGVDGGIAGDFEYFYDGWSLGRSGEYAGVTNLAKLRFMTNATVSIWAFYRTAPSGNYLEDGYATPISGGYAVRGAWELGRTSSDYTELDIFTNGNTYVKLAWPDRTYQTDGNSGGWHHYAFTFSAGHVQAFYDGARFSEKTFAVEYLTVAGSFLEIGGKTHNGDPFLTGGADIYPNHGWLNGFVDDIRIYNRVLSPSEIQALYNSLDKGAPSTPQGLTSTIQASSQVRLNWNSSTDNFGVAGYTLRRNGAVVAETTATSVTDMNLLPSTTYQYSVEAFDNAGNRSVASALVLASTPAVGSPAQVIVDNRDQPWVSMVGAWSTATTFSGYYGANYVNDGSADKGTKTVTYTPVVPEDGVYQVSIWHPQRSSIATNVPVDIQYDGGLTTVTINQRTGGGAWKSLGAYPLLAGTNTFIRIRTDDTSGQVLADAVRITK